MNFTLYLVRLVVPFVYSFFHHAVLSFNGIITKIFFLTAIWLPHGQLWAIIKEAASLTRC